MEIRFFNFTRLNYSINELVDSQDQQDLFKKLEEIAKKDTFVKTIKKPLREYAINSVVGFKMGKDFLSLVISGIEVYHTDSVTVVVYNLRWFQNPGSINQEKMKKIADYLMENWGEREHLQSFLF